MEVPIKRPSQKDTDEDLIRMQNEFLKNKSRPSVQLELKKPVSCNAVVNEASSNDSAILKPKMEDSKPAAPVFFGIVERNTTGVHVSPPKLSPNQFPMMISKSSHFKVPTRTKSLFVQKMENLAQKKKITAGPSEFTECLQESSIIDGSGLASGNGNLEALRIHKENLATLSSLSKETILKEQKHITEQLGPDLVKFVKSRRKLELPKENSNKGPDDLVKFVKSRRKLKLPKENSYNGSPGVINSVGAVPKTAMHSEPKCLSNRPRPNNSTLSNQNPSISFQKILSGDQSEQILKMSDGYDHDGIILKKILEQDTDILSKPTVKETKTEKVPSRDTVEISEEELPINPKQAGHWLHMNKVEKDKLQWMTMLPKQNPVDIKSGYTARFDFQGKLLSPNEDIPTQQGLHHHSEEPEVPGYTVEELFLLARSSQQSQRIIALETLAQMLENYWQGSLDGCFEVSLLSTLLQAGISPLLRWALDDATIPSIAAAVQAIHSLLVCKSDEACLDWTFSWCNGHISPFLAAQDDEPGMNLDELTDAIIIKLDVIKGFLRMDILPRFRYILEMLCPPLTVCQLIVEILIRIARHSYESAKKIVEFPGLLKTICQKFLPSKWNNSNQNKHTYHAYPLHSALKLIRVIAAADADLAKEIYKECNIIESLCCYLIIDPSDGKLMLKECQNLIIESLKTWQTFLIYGLYMEIYIDMRPLIMRQFEFCQSLSINSNIEQNVQNYLYATHFLRALETVVITSAEQQALLALGCKLPAPFVIVSWDEVIPLLRFAEVCVKHWLGEFSRGAVNTNGTVLLASCLDFVTVFYQKIYDQPTLQGSLSTEGLRSIAQNHLLPCLQSKNSSQFTHLLSQLSSFSILTQRASSGCKRDVKVLTSVGSILWKDDVVPLLKEGTPFPLLSSILNFMITLRNVYADFENEIFECILLDSSLTNYVKNVIHATLGCPHWFDRFEVQLIYQLTELFSLTMCGELSVWYELSLYLVTSVRSPHEWLLEKLMQSVIFNDVFVFNRGRIQAPANEINVERNNILNCSDSCTKEQLQKMAKFYIDTLLPHPSIQNSRCMLQKRFFLLAALSAENCMKPVLENGWPYEPIFNWYQLNKCWNPSKITESSIVYCLQWIHLNGGMEYSVINKLPLSVQYCHLCMIFLIDIDLFLEQAIRELLQKFLDNLIINQRKLDLEKLQWKNISGFDNIYSDLLNQFGATSFGDHVFANYLLLPLQQCYPSKWKKLLLTEYPQVVHVLGIPLLKLATPVKNYMEPNEQDTELIKEYFKILDSGILTRKKSPLLYLMAVHHLHNFISEKSEKVFKFQKALIANIMCSKRKDIAHHILLYIAPNTNADLGFDVHPSLSEDQELHFEKIYGHAVTL